MSTILRLPLLRGAKYPACWVPARSVSSSSTFVQEYPRMKNAYLEDTTLTSFFSRYVLEQERPNIHKDLAAFGERVATELPDVARQCEVEKPWLEHFDAYGRRIDKLHVSAAWNAMHAVSAEEGLIATAYEDHGQYSRLYQVCKLLLFSSASGLYSCPLAMTDGAVTIMKKTDSSVSETALRHLLSRNVGEFWTSGQWMTEKRGGSDVAAGTETIARGSGAVNTEHQLTGYKWFTSASDANMSLTLARNCDATGTPIAGKHGLALYYVDVPSNFAERRIIAARLKDKLGTRQLPTAELQLEDCRAIRLSEDGRGIASISPMLTITRLHNALSSVSVMRRMLLLSRDYCDRREAFGRRLSQFPLHMQTLARMEVECRGCEVMVLEAARLLSLVEKRVASSEQEVFLRVLIPLAKLYTGKQAVAVTSEGLESFGGLGYMEDTGLPVMLRDAQVLPIWEGTTNILSLDVLRAMASTENRAFKSAIKSILTACETAARDSPTLTESCALLGKQCKVFSQAVTTMGDGLYEVAARDLAFSLSRLLIGSFLLDHAAYSKSSVDEEVARRWCSRPDLVSLLGAAQYAASQQQYDSSIVFDGRM